MNSKKRTPLEVVEVPRKNCKFPTIRFLELLNILELLLKKKQNTTKIQPMYKKIPHSLFIFHGVFSGDYTRGKAIAIASSKEEAIKIVVQKAEEKLYFGKLFVEFSNELDKSFNSNKAKSVGEHDDLIGVKYEERYSIMPFSDNHFGTWMQHTTITVEAVRKELETCDPEMISLDNGYAIFSGGGD